MKLYFRVYKDGTVSTMFPNTDPFTKWGGANNASDYEVDTDEGTTKLVTPKNGWLVFGNEHRYFKGDECRGTVESRDDLIHIWIYGWGRFITSSFGDARALIEKVCA